MKNSQIEVYMRYVWMIKTILKSKYITRVELTELWANYSDYSRGHEMCKSTFYNSIRAIEELFGLRIEPDFSKYKRPWRIMNPEKLKDDSLPSTLFWLFYNKHNVGIL